LSLPASMRRSTSDGVRCSRVRSSRFGGRPAWRFFATVRFSGSPPTSLRDEIIGKSFVPGRCLCAYYLKRAQVVKPLSPSPRLRVAFGWRGRNRATAEPPSRQRARISNGTRLLEGLDGRRREARGFAEDPARQREGAAAALLSRTLGFEPEAANQRSPKTIVRLAQIAGAAGRFCQRVLSSAFLLFPLAPVRKRAP
jgi:hypothetical protein